MIIWRQKKYSQLKGKNYGRSLIIFIVLINNYFYFYNTSFKNNFFYNI